MFGLKTEYTPQIDEEYYRIEDYQSNVPRWCPGCGDNGILSSMQRLCRDKQLPPEKTVFVSGIGCSSRFPHYMKTYGFHGVHGRALPLAQGVRLRRPDLNIFVNMGDGDCCSIGTAHWVHAIRYNMKMMAIMHDNNIYGLTKMQVSPTTPRGMKTNTTPYGQYIEPLNPLTTTLGVSNVSFVAQAAEWVPDVMYDIFRLAFEHPGFSFVRVLQRCPHYIKNHHGQFVTDTSQNLILTHPDGIQLSDDLAKIYRNTLEHDPMDIHKAREISGNMMTPPIGILYRNPHVPVYDDIRRQERVPTPATFEKGLNAEFDKFGIEPVGAARK